PSSIKLSFVKRYHRNFTSPQFMTSFTEVSLYSLYIMAVGDGTTLFEKTIAHNTIDWSWRFSRRCFIQRKRI
ncbi:TPA: hypothetical protein ACGY2P_002670, partial [Listeria monocytogenes]